MSVEAVEQERTENGRGDELVRAVVDVPKRLPDEERRLLGELAKHEKHPGKPRARKGLFDKLRDYFSE